VAGAPPPFPAADDFTRNARLRVACPVARRDRAGMSGGAAVPRHERWNLWALCAAQFLTLGGMTAVLPLIPLYLEQIGVTDRVAVKYWTGAIGSAPFAVAVFATPVWGTLADRFGHKPMVVRSVFGIAIATFGMGLAASPAALLGWRGVQGAVSGVFPAAVALVSALTPERRLSRSLAMLQTARSAGALCGPLIGGALADLVGIRGLFVGVGAIAAITGFACAAIITEPGADPAHAAGAGASVGWRDLLRVRPLLAMFLLLALYQAAVMCPWPTLALFVEHLGVERSALATTTGLLVFAAGLPATLAATSWARVGQRTGLARALVVSLVLTGLANAAVGTTQRIGFVFALRAAAGLAMAGFVPLAFEWMNARTAPSARGRTAGLGSTAMMLGNVIGPLIGGWLAVHVGIAATFWVPGAAIAVIGAVAAVAAAVGETS
jgi:DHA1 family multidrug resistance protein-like MFS transporter